MNNRKHRCELTDDPAKKAAANKRAAAVKANLPAGLAQPALRALSGAGIKNLRDLSRFTESELLELHGLGPRAMATLRAAIEAEGLVFGSRAQPTV